MSSSFFSARALHRQRELINQLVSMGYNKVYAHRAVSQLQDVNRISALEECFEWIEAHPPKKTPMTTIPASPRALQTPASTSTPTGDEDKQHLPRPLNPKKPATPRDQEDAIEKLIAMGFERGEAMTAVTLMNKDIDAAVSWILNHRARREGMQQSPAKHQRRLSRELKGLEHKYSMLKLTLEADAADEKEAKEMVLSVLLGAAAQDHRRESLSVHDDDESVINGLGQIVVTPPQIRPTTSKRARKKKLPPSPSSASIKSNASKRSGAKPTTPSSAKQKRKPKKLSPWLQKKRNREEALQKMKRTREKVVAELLSTEQSYVSSLKKLMETYVTPLYSDPDFTKLSRDDCDVVFGNVQAICSLNEKFLSDLEERIAAFNAEQKAKKPKKKKASKAPSASRRASLVSNSDHPDDEGIQIGDLLLPYCSFFKLYIAYVNNHPRALGFLQKVYNKPKKYQAFRAFLEQGRSTVGLALESLLIMPCQRVPRYNLLIRELIKNTSNDSSDLAFLMASQEKMEQTATAINDSLRLQEDTKQLMETQASFSKLNLVKMGRRLLLQEKLLTYDTTSLAKSRFKSLKPSNKQERQSCLKAVLFEAADAVVHRKGTHAYLFLFNDLVVVADKNLGKFSCRYALPITDGLRVVDCDLDEEDEEDEDEEDIEINGDVLLNKPTVVLRNAFWIQGTESRRSGILGRDKEKDESVLVIGDHRTKLRWLQSLRQCIADFNAARSIFVCSHCQTHCDLLSRRQCMMCFNLVHNHCSNHRMRVPGQGKDPQRVCMSCVGRVRRLNRKSRLAAVPSRVDTGLKRNSTVSIQVRRQITTTDGKPGNLSVPKQPKSARSSPKVTGHKKRMTPTNSSSTLTSSKSEPNALGKSSSRGRLATKPAKTPTKSSSNNSNRGTNTTKSTPTKTPTKSASKSSLTGSKQTSVKPNSATKKPSSARTRPGQSTKKSKPGPSPPVPPKPAGDIIKRHMPKPRPRTAGPAPATVRPKSSKARPPRPARAPPPPPKPTGIMDLIAETHKRNKKSSKPGRRGTK